MILLSSYGGDPCLVLEDYGTRNIFENMAYSVVFNIAFTQLGQNFFYEYIIEEYNGQEVVTVGRTRFWIFGGYSNRELFGDI